MSSEPHVLSDVSGGVGTVTLNRPEKMNAFTPITSPAAFTSGPPEFPGLIAASVWIIPDHTCARPVPGSGRTSRPMALITPTVTDGFRSASR